MWRGRIEHVQQTIRTLTGGAGDTGNESDPAPVKIPYHPGLAEILFGQGK